MIQRELQKHQWKAIKRHPMYERNMALKVFTFIMFGMLGLQLLFFGFLLNDMLSDIGPYNFAIDTFNYYLLYILLFDFTIKYIGKQSQSMQIVPYLTLPIKRSKLFNFLLVKEFSNIWNLYFFFLIIPFSFKAIMPHYDFVSALAYILFFYLLCIGNSLLVNIANNLLNRSGWFFFLPIALVVGIVGITLIPGLNIGDALVKVGEMVLDKNVFAWAALLIVLAVFWKINHTMMRAELYRALQGKKISEAGGFSFRIPFIDRLGNAGEFINLELKMILRSKRLKGQMYAGIFFIFYYFFMLEKGAFHGSYFLILFFTMFVIGWVGMVMGQYMFTSESSFFDGLMTRNLSLLDMMRGKYILYISYSVLILLLMMVLVFRGTLDLLFLISVFFYSIGFLFFLMFQNGVYNKSYFDHSESGFFNWKGTSGNMLVVTMIGMFFPIILAMIVKGIFGETVACYFMLITGIIFTLSANHWMKWTYNRFLIRKYKNMEGFRSNT